MFRFLPLGRYSDTLIVLIGLQTWFSILAGVCGASKLVGPTGILSSPGYPNSYNNNAYCRSKIVVAQSKRVAFNIPTFKTESAKDFLELRDGKTGHLLYMLSGVLRSPLQITSPSNEMDVRFVTSNNDTLDGFTANYFASCKTLTSLVINTICDVP